MDEIEAKILGRQLMEVADAAYLTTIDVDGFPHTRAMFNLRNRDHFPRLNGLFAKHRDDFLVLFSTNTSSTKVEQIGDNPASCVYYSTPMQYRGLMLAGEMEVVADTGLKNELWHEGWERYYPRGREDPDYAVLSIYPRRGEYYHRLDRCSFRLEGRRE